MKKTVLAFAAMLATLGAAQAQNLAPEPSPTHLLVGMGLSGGGDKLATVQYTNGDSATIHAGGLVYFTFGFDHYITPEVSLQGTINYHVDNSSAKNGDLKFERFPIELMAYYRPHPIWRVGGGIRYAMNPKLSGSGYASGINYSFDNAVSAVAEAEYFVNPKLGIKLRYVNEKYKVQGKGDIDGSYVGISGNYYF